MGCQYGCQMLGGMCSIFPQAEVPIHILCMQWIVGMRCKIGECFKIGFYFFRTPVDSHYPTKLIFSSFFHVCPHVGHTGLSVPKGIVTFQPRNSPYLPVGGDVLEIVGMRPCTLTGIEHRKDDVLGQC